MRCVLSNVLKYTKRREREREREKRNIIMFHQSFYPSSKFHNHRMANQFYKRGRATFYPSNVHNNRSSQNLNFTRDFDGVFTMPTHAFTSMPNGGPQRFWRAPIGRYPRQYPRAPVFHFQDKSTFYYMSDPILTPDHRITVGEQHFD